MARLTKMWPSNIFSGPALYAPPVVADSSCLKPGCNQSLANEGIQVLIAPEPEFLTSPRLLRLLALFLKLKHPLNAGENSFYKGVITQSGDPHSFQSKDFAQLNGGI